MNKDCMHIMLRVNQSNVLGFSIRGRLGSLTPLFRNIGVLISYIISGTVKYQNIPAILIFIPILYMVFLFFLPNTPQYHLQTENIKVKKLFFVLFCESLIAIETFFRTLNVNMENAISGSGKIVKILQRL